MKPRKERQHGRPKAAPLRTATVPIQSENEPSYHNTHTPPTDAAVLLPTIATCGFISGNPDFPITCHSGDNCRHFPGEKLVACCNGQEGAACVPSTRCLDRTDSALANRFDGGDMVCLDDRAPYCKTDVIGDDGSFGLKGYSLFICDTDKDTETVMHRISTPNGPTLTIYSETHPIASITTFIPIASAGEGSNLSSSSPVGIIGGAVAGIIGGLIIIVAGWLLSRELVKRRDVNRAASNHATTNPQRRRFELPWTEQQGPVELPDSSKTATQPAGIPLGPVSPMSPQPTTTINNLAR